MTWNAGEKAASNAAFKCLCLAHCFSAACAFNVAVSMRTLQPCAQRLLRLTAAWAPPALPAWGFLSSCLHCYAAASKVRHPHGIFCSPSFQNSRPNIYSLYCTSGAGSHCNSTGRRYSNSKRHRYQKMTSSGRPCAVLGRPLILATMSKWEHRLETWSRHASVSMSFTESQCASWPLQLIKSWSKMPSQLRFCSLNHDIMILKAFQNMIGTMFQTCTAVLVKCIVGQATRNVDPCQSNEIIELCGYVPCVPFYHWTEK